MKFVCYKEFDDPQEPTFPGLLYKGKTLPLARVIAVSEAFHPRGLTVPDDLNALVSYLSSYREAYAELEKNKTLDQIWQEVGVTPAAPLPRPNRVFGIGRNFKEHAEELDSDLPDKPIVFLKSPGSVIGSGRPIVLPPDLGRIDYEGELAVVIGRHGKDVDESESMSLVAGYTLANDITARDEQRRYTAQGLPWFLPKGRDTFCPLGPCLVTADEIKDPQALELTLTVNGEVKQQCSMSLMVFTVRQLLSYLSHQLTLEPGDVILTGTPFGVGPLHPGDTVEVTIPEIGILSNPVIGLED